VERATAPVIDPFVFAIDDDAALNRGHLFPERSRHRHHNRRAV
jgi:hypothetical protein